MKISKTLQGKTKFSISKSEWIAIGEKEKWSKISQIIPYDGLADGGESYTEDEMALSNNARSVDLRGITLGDLEWAEQTLKSEGYANPSMIEIVRRAFRRDKLANTKKSFFKNAGFTAEEWETLDSTKKRNVVRHTVSVGLTRQIGIGLNDLPDTTELQVENWWNEDMNMDQTITAINDMIHDIVTNIESGNLDMF
jgi:hypothetical protein